MRAVRGFKLALWLGMLLALCWAGAGKAGAAGTANVTVDLSQPSVQLPNTAIGLNTAVWDGHLQDAPVNGLIRQTGTELLRFPGGSTADNYHWQTNTVEGGYANPANTFDNFMRNVVQPTGTQAMITVNYGSGSPQEAAGWVNYANNVQKYGVKYWEIGNEIYGNGYFYGVQWETDNHSSATGSARSGDPNLSPTAYGTNALAFTKAMKAQDPTIKVGLVLTAPENWPDYVSINGGPTWNAGVLSTACQAADFVSVHWYAQQPGSESDQGLLADPYTDRPYNSGSIAGMVATLRSEINHYCGTHASQVGVMITETNSVSYNPGRQTTSPINGLFLTEDYLEWLQNGVQNVSWWDLHNSPVTWGNNSPTLAGTPQNGANCSSPTPYGDYGILATGEWGGCPEPPANTPFPTFTAMKLLTKALAPGATFLRTSSTLPAVRAYALRETGGHLAIALVNTDAQQSYTINAAVMGLDRAASATATTFSLGSPQLSSAPAAVQGGNVSYTIAPYSATVIDISRGND